MSGDLQLASELIRVRRYADAAAEAVRYLAANPESVAAHELLALAQMELDDHAGAALAAARAMARRIAEEVPEIGAGIGVSTGEVVAGNVGHHERFEYTVIGDAVNAAARLTELAKEVPGRVLTCAETLAEADEAERAHWRTHDTVTLRGRSAETELLVRA